MKHKTYGSLVPWVDIYMNIAMSALLLFVLAFISITVKLNKNEEGIQPKADFLITLDWNPKDNVDIDLWVRDPNGKLVSFMNKSITGMFLDRDDTGIQHDTIQNRDGSKTVIEINQEVMTVRGFIPGKYTIAAHYYSGKIPQNLSISILKLQPFQYVYKKSDIPIQSQGQEVTLLTMEISKDGKIVSTNSDPDFFVNARAR